MDPSKIDVLLVNSDHTPLRVINLDKALDVFFRGKAYVARTYDRTLGTPSGPFPIPAVLALYNYEPKKRGIRFKRKTVYANYGYRCAYCGETFTHADLTYDHVYPKSRAVNGLVPGLSGRMVQATGWDNVVPACRSCNAAKRDRTPQEASMPLLYVPRKPRGEESVAIAVKRAGGHIPDEWKDYLFL